MSTTAEVVVVGAGLAGLCCTRRLLSAGAEVVLLERDARPGGRVATDEVDGFLLDRGFQLLNPDYPEVRRQLDLAALQLRALPAGVVVSRGRRQHVLADPRRVPARALPRILRDDALGLGSIRAKLAFGRWALHCTRTDPAELLAGQDTGWGDELRRRGIDGDLRHAVVEQFLAGVLAEEDGSTSRRFVELLVRSFVRGTPSVPAAGMGAIPAQLAAALPAGVLRTGTAVSDVTAGEGDVQLRADGVTLGAKAVVVATDPVTAAGLTGVPEPVMRGLTTFWHAADTAPTPSGMLHLDGDRLGPVVNTAVMSNAAAEYAPGSRALIASTVLGAQPDVEATVRRQLGRVYRTDSRGWQLLRTDVIPQALPALLPPLDARQPPDLGGGLFVAGDHRDTASIQGAMVSGRRAADAVLAHLGRAVPPRPSLPADSSRRGARAA